MIIIYYTSIVLQKKSNDWKIVFGDKAGLIYIIQIVHFVYLHIYLYILLIQPSGILKTSILNNRNVC